MTKKVLILSASPRRSGNSDLLCDQFMLGAEEAGNQVEKIFLRDKKINYCMACSTCQENGGICHQDDDMAEVLDKMIASDVIVLATPVYFYSMNAQLKTLIDRTYPRYISISNKEIYIIITAAVNSKHPLESTIESIRGFTHLLPGSEEKGIIYGIGAWKMGDIKGSKAMDEAYQMGKAL